MVCVICGGMKGAEHIFREMMFGTRDEFAYWECSSCGCLQISNVPENIGSYYPDDYYTFSLQATPLQLLMYRAYCKIPRVAKLLRPAGVTFQSIIDAKLKPGARVLDVGCGSGKLVTILRSLGFDAQGIDPFVKTESTYVRRTHLEDDLRRDWDLIMFHHSLEHMNNHTEVLRSAREKLATGGTCLVRIPLANWAWRHYKENWVQLDPPRHLIIHTPRSFRLAAEAAGLRIERITFDSGPFQFYGSELYQRGIPLKEEHSEKAHIDKAAMHSFKIRSAALNAEESGDQAAFYLKTF